MESFVYPGEYLDSFDERDRSFVTQQFCFSFHEWARGQGQPSPAELLVATCARVLRAYREDDPRAELLEGIYGTMRTEEALRFATFIVMRETLVPEERARLRAEKDYFYRRKFMGRRPTRRQISYLRRVGCCETPTTRLEAAALIKRLAAGRSKPQAA